MALDTAGNNGTSPFPGPRSLSLSRPPLASPLSILVGILYCRVYIHRYRARTARAGNELSNQSGFKSIARRDGRPTIHLPPFSFFSFSPLRIWPYLFLAQVWILKARISPLDVSSFSTNKPLWRIYAHTWVGLTPVNPSLEIQRNCSQNLPATLAILHPLIIFIIS